MCVKWEIQSPSRNIPWELYLLHLLNVLHLLYLLYLLPIAEHPKQIFHADFAASMNPELILYPILSSKIQYV